MYNRDRVKVINWELLFSGNRPWPGGDVLRDEGMRYGADAGDDLPGRYIDPLTDWGFRYLFGRPAHRDVLLGFLNGLFGGRKTVVDVSYVNTERDGVHPGNRRAVFDLLCRTDTGALILIEVQRLHQRFFKDRSLFYVSRLIQELLSRGAEGSDFELAEVHFIGVLDFVLEGTTEGKYLHQVALRDEDPDSLFYDKLSFRYLVVPNFHKGPEELETDFDRWMYLLKHLHRLKEMPLGLDPHLFGRLFDISEIKNLTKEERMLYKEDWMVELDRRAQLASATEKGIAEGHQKGIVEGIEKGVQKAKAAMIKSLILDFGFTDEQVVRATKMPLEEVQGIRRTLAAMPN